MHYPLMKYGYQEILVGQNPKLIVIKIFLCEQSKKLTNMGICYPGKLYP